MKLKCIRPFGNFVPGDEVEVQDGVTFDRVNFEEVVTEDVPVEGDK